jgi:hypothetical protein
MTCDYSTSTGIQNLWKMDLFVFFRELSKRKACASWKVWLKVYLIPILLPKLQNQ